MLRAGRTTWDYNTWTCSYYLGFTNVFLKQRRRLHVANVSPRLAKIASWSLSNGQLPQTPARTRFAPSPTGYLHLGSLRTALYNYLLAKATGGQFLLRIEDTDSKRTISGAEERICQDLEWAGLHWDEGPKVGGPCGPYRQSERTALYSRHVDLLLDSGNAYRCFCSQERLNSLARERSSLGLATPYDRMCLGVLPEESSDRASRGEIHVIRFKSPPEYLEYHDTVYGWVGGKRDPRSRQRHINSFEDVILLKSDGSPTYHLANVVDDHHMEITHVIRGVEWMPSTPKHLELYQAFGWNPPALAHVGLLQDNTRQKLSKRDHATNLDGLKDAGILPEALLNFLALLGWSHPLKSDVLTIQQLIEIFNFKFTKGNVVVNIPKLNYLSGLHFRRYVDEGGEKFEEIVNEVFTLLEREPVDGPQIDFSKLDFLAGRDPRDFIAALLKADTEKVPNSRVFYERHKHLFTTEPDVSSEAKAELPGQESDQVFRIAGAAQKLVNVPPAEWSTDMLKKQAQSIATEVAGFKSGTSGSAKKSEDTRDAYSSLLHWLRWALVRGHAGPNIFKMMELFGRTVTLNRLERARTDLADF